MGFSENLMISLGIFNLKNTLFGAQSNHYWNAVIYYVLFVFRFFFEGVLVFFFFEGDFFLFTAPELVNGGGISIGSAPEFIIIQSIFCCWVSGINCGCWLNIIGLKPNGKPILGPGSGNSRSGMSEFWIITLTLNNIFKLGRFLSEDSDNVLGISGQLSWISA